MNSQIQFETNGLRVLVVPVPEDAKDFFINNVGCLRYSTMQGKLSKCIEPEQLGVYLDEKWKILLTTDTEITDEQLEVILPQTHKYRRFSHLMEILRSKGINPNEKHIILIEENEMDKNRYSQ